MSDCIILTPKEVKLALGMAACKCGAEKRDHDFGFGGNSDTGCETFTPTDPKQFDLLVKTFYGEVPTKP